MQLGSEETHILHTLKSIWRFNINRNVKKLFTNYKAHTRLLTSSRKNLNNIVIKRRGVPNLKNIYFSNLEHLCIPSNTVPAPAIRYYVTSFISDHVTRRQWRLIRHLAVSWYFTSLGRPDRHKLCEFLCWKRLLVEFFNSNLFKRNDVDSWRVLKDYLTLIYS